MILYIYIYIYILKVKKMVNVAVFDINMIFCSLLGEIYDHLVEIVKLLSIFIFRYFISEIKMFHEGNATHSIFERIPGRNKLKLKDAVSIHFYCYMAPSGDAEAYTEKYDNIVYFKLNNDDDDWCFTATFVHMLGYIGRLSWMPYVLEI